MSSHDNRTPPLPAGRIVACPGCKGDSLYAPSNPYRPCLGARGQNQVLGARGPAT